MKKIILTLFLITSIVSCNKTTPDSNKATKVNAGSIDQIIARSGTTFRNKDRALKDAQNRLSSGGGLLGEKPGKIEDLFEKF